MSPNSLRVDCRKFVPNIFNKTKCSNCFKQKEEHSAEALECNRAMRKVAKSGYLFVAPDWDFSIPLNRTKRWQRRWFVLYDDGELNYSVDEHPDTVPQASIDMNTVLEVAGAEDVTGHVFSFAITAPDRVTFVKGVAREEARAWTSVLAVYTRNKRHKRNATFPGGQTTTIHQTHHTPRSGTPNPIRPRYNSCHSESMRPPIRWSQEKPSSETPKATEIIKNTTIPAPEIITTVKNTTIPTSTNLVGSISPIGTLSTSSSSASCNSSSYRNTGYRDQPPSSASPPTRDKLNSEEKAFARRTNKHKKTPETPDCVDSPIDDYETSSKRLETLKDIAQILTRPRSAPGPTPNTPTRDSDTEERLNLPAETLLHLKKGWLMLKSDNQWIKLWFVLCGQELKAFKDSLEDLEEFKVRLSQIKSVGEITVQRNYGFQINLWNDTFYVLSAVTSGIRSNWLETVRRAASLNDLPPRPTRLILSSDEEYRTASEGGRRESGEWAPVSPPLARTPISRVKERAKTRSRTSTLDSVSTDELLSADLQKLQINLQRSEEDKFLCLNQLKETLEKYETLNRDYLNKNTLNNNLQEELNCVNERLKRGIEENDFLYKKLQELEKNSSFGSFSDLTNIDLDLDFKNITLDNLIDEYNNLKNRFEKAVEEIKAMKRELRNSNIKYDDLELSNITLKQDLQKIQSDNKYENNMMAARIQDLTQKLTNSEKQVRNLKSKLQDSREKRRSLSLKGRESFSINKEVEDKINELEAKVLNLETSKKSTKKQQNSDLEKKNQRRLRRKSLDSTTSEPMKLLIKLSCLESKVANFDNSTTSNENLNQSDANSKILSLESTIEAVKIKLNDCQNELRNFNYEQLATLVSEAISILKNQNNVTSGEVDVITNSVVNLVQNFEKLLTNKLLELNKKRKKLRESNMLTSQNSLAILAEKLAYETVLISRINEALNTIHSPETKFSSRILRKEIFETSNLLQQLENKICSQSVKIAPKSLENHLVKVLTSHLIHINYLTNNNRNYSRNCEDLSKSLQYLLEKQQKVNQQLQQYKSEKMEQLVYNLALETLNFNQDDEKSVKEVWKSAQESVGLELIQAEISHVLSRVAQVYSSSENEPFLTVWAAEKAALELFGDVLEERLQKELKLQAEELKIAVKGVVNKLRPTTPWRRRLELERKSYSGNHSLLTEFANILTHKALIDARISILSEEVDVFSPPSETFLPVDIFLEGQRYLWLLEDSSNLTSNSIQQAEFQTLFFNFQNVASSEMTSIEHQVPNQVKEALFGVENEVARLQNVSCGGNEVNCWKDVVKKCLELKERLEKVPQVVKCEKCQQLKDSLHRLSREHSLELAVQESTQSQLRERAFLLEQRLGTLDTEYAKQLEQLRTAYRETLTTPSPASSPGESASEGLRARYQAEIEQLRALCEKGLAAVESTHRRVVTELQDKHRREREHLLEEKEQALAEETQATLAALDAMRKAHEHEVRREVTKFKADFLRRLQATHDLGALHQQHESEMREIKKEILALSERYSVKCVESASLEEQLCSVHQQLDNANKYIEQLDKRNKQLEAVAIAGTS